MSDNENVNKVMDFLDRVKINPQKETHPQDSDMSTTLNVRNYNFTINALYLFLTSLVIVIALICGIILVSFIAPNKSLDFINTAHVINQISVTQADNFKNIVSAVARCENKHYNTIHAELRQKFNYVRYKDLDKATYEQVLNYLKPRLCMK